MMAIVQSNQNTTRLVVNLLGDVEETTGVGFSSVIKNSKYLILYICNIVILAFTLVKYFDHRCTINL